MEDDRVSNKKLLVAGNNERYETICGGIPHMLEDEKQNRNTSGKVKVKQGTREAVDISDSRLYHKVTISSWKKCNPSSL